MSLVIAVVLLLPRTSRADLPPDCKELGPAVLSHSCFHAQFGPYAVVQATAGSSIAETTPNVDAVHTLFEVRLPVPLGENTVSYRVASPDRAGAWAIFSDAAVSVRVLAPTGETLAPLLEQSIEPCGPLTRATVYRLEDVRYGIVLGDASVTRTPLVLEHVDDFVSFNGRDKDGDGYGDPSDTVVTMCAPPAGYVANDGDCDDTNAAIYPGAVELCEGIDTNCNGIADDVGLPCSSGVGACKASGTFTCVSPGSPVTCSAVPKLASAETCNGVDENCNGLSDRDEPMLCIESNAPRCVSVLGMHRCGCDRDADCGGNDSGRICDLDERRCTSGCVDHPDRNACPAGLLCSSQDPAKPGACIPANAECTSDADCPEGTTCSPSQLRCVTPAPSVVSDAGCGCRLSDTRGSDFSAVFAVLLGWLVVMRRHARSRDALRASLVLAGPFVVGCSGGVEVVGGAEEVCLPALGESLIAHACSHTSFGELLDVVAFAEDGPEPPFVDAIHQAYRVTLLPEGAAYGGFLSYRASRDGEHAILTGPSALVSARPIGESEPLLARRTQPVATCASLSGAVVVDLRKDMVYDLRLGPLDTNTLVLFIEHVETFGGSAWASTCGLPAE